MKNNRTFSIITYLVISSILLLGSQCKKDKKPDPEPEPTITCTSNITDGCMDDWKTITTYNGNYINPTGDFLQSLNELASLPVPLGPGPATAEAVTDCVQGTFAAKLTSKIFYIQSGTDTVFIPGYIGTSVLDIPNATIHLGKPYASRPQRFQGYYKYAPVGGDSALIEVMLTRFNTSAGKRDTVSFDRLIVKNAVSSYTQLDFALSYWDNVNNPDTLTLIFSASANINFVNLMGAAGREGSVMHVDDLKFVFP